MEIAYCILIMLIVNKRAFKANLIYQQHTCTKIILNLEGNGKKVIIY